MELQTFIEKVVKERRCGGMVLESLDVSIPTDGEKVIVAEEGKITCAGLRIVPPDKSLDKFINCGAMGGTKDCPGCLEWKPDGCVVCNECGIEFNVSPNGKKRIL